MRFFHNFRVPRLINKCMFSSIAKTKEFYFLESTFPLFELNQYFYFDQTVF